MESGCLTTRLKGENEILLEQKRDHVEKKTLASELGTFQPEGRRHDSTGQVRLPVAQPQEESPWQALLDTHLPRARSSPEVPALNPHCHLRTPPMYRSRKWWPRAERKQEAQVWPTSDAGRDPGACPSAPAGGSVGRGGREGLGSSFRTAFH